MKTKYQHLIQISLFAALTSVGAFIKIPFPILPITLQPVFSLLAGLILGAKYGSASQALYMFIGLVGLPVFTKGGGMWYISEPSFGFILGFIACSAVSGAVNSAFKNKFSPYIASFCGIITLYLIGGTYMYMILKVINLKQNITFWFILTNAVFPYIIKDFILFMIASLVSVKLNKILKNKHYPHN